MPRLLVVDELFAPPEISRTDGRFASFCNRLPDYGWEPVVFSQYVSRRFNGMKRLGKIVFPHLFNGELSHRGPAARLGVPIPVRPGSNGVHGQFFAPILLQTGRSLLRRRSIDLVFSTGRSLASHQFVARLLQRLRVPWVADFSRLLLPASLEERGGELPQEAAEICRGILDSGGLIVVHTEDLRNRWLELFPRMPRARVRVVPDGYDPSVGEDLFDPAEKARAFTLLFAQPLVNLKALATFLTALTSVLAKHPTWQNEFRILWRGPVPERMQQFLQQKKLTKIFKPIREEEWRKIDRLPDFHLVLALVPEQIHGDFFVSPMLNALLAAKRPFLAIGPESGIRRMVREEGLGREFGVDDARGVAAALIYWFVEFKSNAFSLLSQLPSHLTLQATSRRLAELFDHVWNHTEYQPR